MTAHLVATLCAGLFAGAALYINLVEHPARLEAGLSVAIAEFAPSYRRAAIMQASLAIAGTAAAILSWLGGSGPGVLIGGLVLFAVIPFTLVVVFPTNKRLLDSSANLSSAEATELLSRWAKLHAVRSALGLAAFFLLLVS